MNPIANRDLREENSDNYGYSNPAPYNYCFKARFGNHIIRGIGHFDTPAPDSASDECEDKYEQLGSDIVFGRICVCFSDNCNEGQI